MLLLKNFSMKNIKNIIYVPLILVLMACQTSEPEQQDLALLAKSNQYIEVDMKYFNDIDYATGIKTIPDEAMRNIKAVIYRIYSNVDIVDNQYVLRISSGKDIHISDTLFNIYYKHLKKANDYFTTPITASSAMEEDADMKKEHKGKYPVASPIGEEYLNSLLR